MVGFSKSINKVSNQFLTTGSVGMLNTKLEVESENEGKNVLSIIQSTLFRFFSNHYQKTSGFNPAVKNSIIPKLDSNKHWTDEEIYKEFNLTEEEIKYIKKNQK